MIVIYGANMYNNKISWCFFSILILILIFRVVSELEGQKMAKNDKNLSVASYISRTIYHMIFIYGTRVHIDG